MTHSRLLHRIGIVSVAAACLVIGVSNASFAERLTGIVPRSGRPLILRRSPRSSPVMRVTECGLRVPEGARAILDADLNCAGRPRGISLDSGATLELNGHRISGADNTIFFQPFRSDGTFVDENRWALRGPGEVSASREGAFTLNPACVRVQGSGVLTVSDVVIADCEIGGIFAELAEVRAERVTIRGSYSTAIGARSLSLERVLVEDAGGFNGIFASGKIAARGLTVRGCRTGVVGESFSGQDVDLMGNAERGIDVSGAVTASRLTATGNGGSGVRAGDLITLVDSTVVGNGEATGEADLVSGDEPRLIRSTCGRSAGIDDPSVSFGVCANDP